LLIDYLKEKTCILITHQVQYLSDVDQIVLMDNVSIIFDLWINRLIYNIKLYQPQNYVFYFYLQGKIVTEGSYNNLKASSFEFANLLGSSESTNTENEIETNNMNNNSADSRLVSSLHRSNNSIISSNNENQINDVESSKPNKISSLQSYEYNSKNIFISYIKSGGSTPNILFCIFMCIFTQVLTTSGDYWLSIWYYLFEFSLTTNQWKINMKYLCVLYILFSG